MLLCMLLVLVVLLLLLLLVVVVATRLPRLFQRLVNHVPPPAAVAERRHAYWYRR